MDAGRIPVRCSPSEFLFAPVPFQAGVEAAMKLSSTKSLAAALLVVAMVLGPVANPAAQASDDPKPRSATPSAVSTYVPDLPPLMNSTTSELREVVERYSTDRAALLRRYGVEYSPTRRAQLREFNAAWQTRLQAVDFDKLSADARIDYVLLMNRLRQELVLDRKSTRLNSSHIQKSRMPSSA